MTDLYHHYDLFGFKVNAFRKEDLLQFIGRKIAKGNEGRGVVLAHHNLHGLSCAMKSKPMERLLSDDDTYVYIDGMPIVWMSRLKGEPVTGEHRLTSLDWAPELLERAERMGWKVAYVGSTPDICEKGIRHFRDLHPTLDLRGWDGYFDMAADDPASKKGRMVAEINAFSPDILIVGMGMPRQEEFLDLQRDLDFRVAICIGAFFEYFVGGQPLPPRWMGRVGLEWSYRLFANPSRYAHRYLVEPISLAFSLFGRAVFRR